MERKVGKMDLKLSFPRGRDLSALQEEIRRQNLKSFHILAAVGLPLAAVDFICFLLTGSSAVSGISIALLVYFGLLFAADRLFVRDRGTHATALLYLSTVPVYILSVIGGTILLPDAPAAAVLLLIVALPAMIMDIPSHVIGFNALFAGLFAAMSYAVKPTDLFVQDLVHLVTFFLVSVVLTLVVLRNRFDSAQSFRNLQDQYFHDTLTGFKNRNALNAEGNRFLKKDIVILFFDMDDFKAINDVYGHEVGDRVLQTYFNNLAGVFGEENCFRYGGDEFLIFTMMKEQDIRDRVAEQMNRFEEMQVDENITIRARSSCGYCVGNAADRKTLSQMIRFADVQIGYAKKKFSPKISGGPFDSRALRPTNIRAQQQLSAGEMNKDPLTGLATMKFFFLKAEDQVDGNADLSWKPVFLYFNILGMKNYNEKYGFYEGDDLLHQFADVLQNTFPGRLVSRFADDHFVVLVSRDEADERTGQPEAALQQRFPDRDVHIKAGLYQFVRGDTVPTSCDRAKLACDNIRDNVSVQSAWYDQKLDAKVRTRQYVLDSFERAIANHEFKVYYQPIFRAVTNEQCQEEALARWEDPRLGMISPAAFIPILEENHRSVTLDLYILDQVLKDFTIKRQNHLTALPVSVNLSEYDFEEEDLVDIISRRVQAAGVYPRMIIFEITEDAFVRNYDRVRSQIQRFHKAGFKVWMDNFGSGHTSLNLLANASFDLIKMDLKYLKTNQGDEEKMKLVLSNLINLAKKLQVGTLAEGVETDGQYAMLRDMGCEKLQGFLFDTPHPLEYILEQVKLGNGVPTENPRAIGYYEEIGSINLNDPFSYGDDARFERLTYTIPAGVIEIREGLFATIRANQEYAEFQRRMGTKSDLGSRARRDDSLYTPSAPFAGAVNTCMQTGKWESIAMKEQMSGRQVTCFLHRIGRNETNGSQAVLHVVLYVS